MEDKIEGQMIVLISTRSVYGNELIYPENELAKRFAEFSGKSTLSLKDLRLIKSLGFKIDIVMKNGGLDEAISKIK